MHDHSAIIEDKVYKISNQATGHYIECYRGVLKPSTDPTNYHVEVRFRSFSTYVPFTS
jgi:hypothetical protein